MDDRSEPDRQVKEKPKKEPCSGTRDKSEWIALWHRISRVLASFRQEQLDERELVGIQGEEYATEIIAGVNPQCHIANAVVPSANGRYCETDHVVLVGGTVFIVEVKNYKGRLVWEDAGERGLMHWKTGNYGETILPKPARNPIAQARSYIRPAKAYLSSRGAAGVFRLAKG